MIPESPLSDDVALHYTDMYKERVKPIVLSPVAGSEAGSDSGGGGGGSGGDEGGEAGEAGGEEGGSGGSDGEGDASGGSGGRRAEGGGSPSGSPTASPGASPRARRAAAATRSGRKVKESKYERRRRRLVLREARLSNVAERCAEEQPTCYPLASHLLPTCLLLACYFPPAFLLTCVLATRYTEETAPLEELRGTHGSPPRGVSMERQSSSERQASMPRIDSGMDLSLQVLK